MPSLNFTMQFQRHLNWCWAATTVSIEKYYIPASTLTQCSLVNTELRRTDCCNFSSSTPWHECNSTYYLDDSLRKRNLLANFIANHATFPQIQNEINNPNIHPIALRIAWLLGGAHFMVISGYYQTAIGNFLKIQDPIFMTTYVPYDIFPKGYWGSLGTWTHSYFTH